MKVILVFLWASLSFNILAKEVLIQKDLRSVPVIHNNQPLEIERNQNRSHKIMKFYQDTWRGKIQPMYPFKPHPVETIGELEVIEYVKLRSHGDDSIMVIDSRPQSATTITGMIPGASRISVARLLSAKDRDATLSRFGVNKTQSGYDFTEAKTLILYCNGFWCGKSPRMIRRLLYLGYPAEKLKYYRGGMQAWRAVGLTTVRE